jgi:hypothetical protein
MIGAPFGMQQGPGPLAARRSLHASTLGHISAVHLDIDAIRWQHPYGVQPIGFLASMRRHAGGR